MKVLVTGGTGFIGSRVVDLLVENGHSVRLFSRRQEVPIWLRGRDVELFRGDLEDLDAVAVAMIGADLFYHIGEIKNTSARAAARNVQLVEHILSHMDSAGLRRLVFISSLTVAGIPLSIPANEDTPVSIILEDLYTNYKRQGESLIAQSSGAEYAIIRPGVVYGSGSRYLPGLVKAVSRLGSIGLPFVGAGNNIAPLIHVRDLALAVYLAGMNQEASGRTYNLTDGLTHTWLDFFQAIAGSQGKRFRLIPVPTFLLRTPAIAFDKLARLFDIRFSLENYVKYATADLLFDMTRAKHFLQWKPAYDLAAGAEEMSRGMDRKRH